MARLLAGLARRWIIPPSEGSRNDSLPSWQGPAGFACSVDDRRLQAESFEAPHQGFWRLLEDAGERPDVFGADCQDLAVEVATPHLDHADVALQDRGLGAVGLGEAYEV